MLPGWKSAIERNPFHDQKIFQVFPRQAVVFTCLQYKSFENTVGKGEIAGAISPFSTMFSALSENFPPFSSNLKLLSVNSLSLEESKICHLGNG